MTVKGRECMRVLDPKGAVRVGHSVTLILIWSWSKRQVLVLFSDRLITVANCSGFPTFGEESFLLCEGYRYNAIKMLYASAKDRKPHQRERVC